MAYQVTELSLQLIEALEPLIPRIKQRHKGTADQLVRAASSIALNLGEAQYSDPGTRRARLHNAAGSAGETLVGLQVVAHQKTIVIVKGDRDREGDRDHRHGYQTTL